VLVRNLVRKGNFKVEASGIRVGRRSRGNDEFNPFERALDKLGISCRAFPIQVPRCVCLCMYTKHIRTHTHTHIHTYMCVCVCVCVCVRAQVSGWQRTREASTVYLTCAEDSILRAWDAIERRCVASRDLGFNRAPGCLRRTRRRAVCMTVSPVAVPFVSESG
jgi:hypothetical protein